MGVFRIVQIYRESQVHDVAVGGRGFLTIYRHLHPAFHACKLVGLSHPRPKHAKHDFVASHDGAPHGVWDDKVFIVVVSCKGASFSSNQRGYHAAVFRAGLAVVFVRFLPYEHGSVHNRMDCAVQACGGPACINVFCGFCFVDHHTRDWSILVVIPVVEELGSPKYQLCGDQIAEFGGGALEHARLVLLAE